MSQKAKKEKYTSSFLNECGELYNSGLSVIKIAEQLKVTTNIIDYCLQKNKTKKDAKRIRVNVNLEEAVRLHNEGKNLPQIAEILGVGVTTLKRRGLHKLVDTYSFYKNRSFPKDYSFFKLIDTEEKAYYLGLLLADGSVDNDGLKLELKSEDDYILEIFKNLISPKSQVKTCTRTRQHKGYTFTGTMSRLDISSKDIVNDLKILGIEQNKTYKVQRVPKQIPSNLIHHFIRGLFDGDGSVWINNKTKKLSINFTGEFNLLTEVKSLLLNIGLNPKVKVIKKPHQTDSYIVYSSQKDIKTFFNWLYKDATIYMKRKYIKFSTNLI